MNGFYNIIKPVGFTASDVVVKIKRIVNQSKVGHLGTLDPGASGVLPIAVGSCTKLFNFLTYKIKKYRAFITFGITTDTLDSYGKITATSDVVPDLEAVTRAVASFTGKSMQLPPKYSALSVGGVRAYNLARSGQEFTLMLREIEISDISVVRQVDSKTYCIDIVCSGGTYIRSIARDLGERLNTVAYMSGLIRLQSGKFTIDDAVTLDELIASPLQYLYPQEYAFCDLDKITFSKEFYKQLVNGVKISCEDFDGYRQVFCEEQLIALAKCNNGRLETEYLIRND